MIAFSSFFFALNLSMIRISRKNLFRIHSLTRINKFGPTAKHRATINSFMVEYWLLLSIRDENPPQAGPIFILKKYPRVPFLTHAQKHLRWINSQSSFIYSYLLSFICSSPLNRAPFSHYDALKLIKSKTESTFVDLRRKQHWRKRYNEGYEYESSE